MFHRRQLACISQVGRQRRHGRAMLALQALGQLVQPLAAARHDDEIMSVAGKPLGKGRANARRGAGDQRSWA